MSIDDIIKRLEKQAYDFINREIHLFKPDILEFNGQVKRTAEIEIKHPPPTKKPFTLKVTIPIKRRSHTEPMCPEGSVWSAVKGECIWLYEWPCPDGHFFSPITRQCESIDSVKDPQVTPSTTGDKGGTPQPGTPVKRWVPKATTEKSCPQGYSYNPKYGICIPNGWPPDHWLKFLKKQK